MKLNGSWRNTARRRMDLSRGNREWRRGSEGHGKAWVARRLMKEREERLAEQRSIRRYSWRQSTQGSSWPEKYPVIRLASKAERRVEETKLGKTLDLSGERPVEPELSGRCEREIARRGEEVSHRSGGTRERDGEAEEGNRRCYGPLRHHTEAQRKRKLADRRKKKQKQASKHSSVGSYLTADGRRKETTQDKQRSGRTEEETGGRGRYRREKIGGRKFVR